MTDLLDGLPPWPTGDFSVYGDVTVEPMPRMQKYVAASMGRNWVAIPHVTHHDEADVTALEQARKERASRGERITLVPILVKLLAQALEAFPQFNQSLDPRAGQVIRKHYIHIGVAVDTEKGLLVPVIRDCDRKPLIELSTEISDLSGKAREKGLSMNEMSGGCITLTSLGHIGGTFFTPIVNAPEVAIVGVTRTRTVAHPAEDGSVEWRQMLPISLSYDHRVINGADAARFTRFLAQRLADPSLLS